MHSADFVNLMNTSEISAIVQANTDCERKFPSDVCTAVKFYAYGYADGGVSTTTTRVTRALYCLLELRESALGRTMTTIDVIHVCGTFCSMMSETTIARNKTSA